MAMVKCEDCGRDISSLAPACPGCGRPRETSPTRSGPAKGAETRQGAPQFKTATTSKTGCLGVFLFSAALLGFGFALVTGRTGGSQSQAPAEVAPAAPPPQLSPVSEECMRITNKAFDLGVLRAGDVSRSEIVVIASPLFATMKVDGQRQVAECLSHRFAGSQDSHVPLIVFRNQASGVTYGTIKFGRYTTGE